MREIKFRAWIDYGVHTGMHYDDYDYLYHDGKIYFQHEGNYKVEYGIEKGIQLMQYTGLKDKNGKEIYSGDILFNEIKNGVVQWSDKYMGWMASEIHKMDGEGIYEVIGNIYEHPELLADLT